MLGCGDEDLVLNGRLLGVVWSSHKWKVLVVTLCARAFRCLVAAVRRGSLRLSERTCLAVPRIADHSGRTIDIYPNLRKHEPDREQHGSAEAARQIRSPIRKGLAPAHPVAKPSGHRHHQNRQAHH